jgi:monoamine oxidase
VLDLKVLPKMLSGQKIDAATFTWENEPITRCSHMALSPGQVTVHWQTLFAPSGHLFFAGEHAIMYQCFMEGAVESGKRAAKIIMESL